MTAPELIEKGHGRTDVSCPHGSRWIWWYDELEKKGKWQNVVFASNCDCGDPPDPFRSKAEMMEYLRKRRRQNG